MKWTVRLYSYFQCESDAIYLALKLNGLQMLSNVQLHIGIQCLRRWCCCSRSCCSWLIWLLAVCIVCWFTFTSIDCHTKSNSVLVLYMRPSTVRSNHFFSSDTMNTDEVSVTKNTKSYAVNASVWNTICNGGK